MARHWTLHDAARESCVSTAAVVGLLQDLHHRSPGRAALGFLGRVLPLDYVTLVEYRGAGAPHQLEGHCRTRAAQDTTARCFSLYRSGFFRHDDATGLAADLAALEADAPRVDLLHYRQREIPDPAWREAIFEREHLAGRISLLFAGGGRAYSVNLYRNTPGGEFDDGELGRLRDVAPLLRAALQPHLGAAAPPADRVALAATRLGERAPSLSPRERQVAARIAAGLSNDGIAADLGVAPSTVLTLRKRVYGKLHLHSRLALVWWLGLGQGTGQGPGESPCQPQGTDGEEGGS